MKTRNKVLEIWAFVMLAAMALATTTQAAPYCIDNTTSGDTNTVIMTALGPNP